MTSSMYQGHGQHQDVVGSKRTGHLPVRDSLLLNARGRIEALKQGSVGDTMSDMQRMMSEEQKQHQQTYNYAHGSHRDDNLPLGEPSF